ncbi:autotransporter outer membrane beta-barrel domain-containing protein [Flavobacterium hydatis]|uniref:hypothetical protein n=1 Tax=Flavobacterium hydatis TaxID=991 RepID=UPI000689EE8D|nr:hypothetical protein [Flavobacterium hydatis]
MKNRLLPLIFVLGSYSAYSQVGIGTTMPNSSSQLEVVANDKGVLIPRIELKNSTDTTTITNGNVNSLLVFNTATIADIKPGYYYWHNNKWNRIVIAGEIESNKGTVIYNELTNDFTYVDASGSNQTINFESILKGFETVTTLTNNNNGTYTYVNEKDDSVTINVVGDVANNFETIVNNPAVTNVLNNFITKSEGTVSYNAVTNEFTYTDASGTTQVVNINEIVKANETITTLVKNAANDGKYLYTNEDKTETTVDVVADVINNASTILNDPKFVTELTQFIDAKETVTTLTNNNNGTYTYVNESDDSVTINVVGDVANNFETIVNNPAVTNVLNNFITKSEGTVSYNAVTNEFTYTDASGTTQVVNINEIVKGNETLTSLTYDATGKTLSYQPERGDATVIKLVDLVGDAETITTLTNNNNGTYTYVNESDDSVTINVVGDVANNFETIVNNPAVTNVLNNFITKSEGTVSYNAVTNEFTYTDASGTTQVVNINEIVKGNETLTSLTYDATGKTLSYQPERGDATVIKLVDLVGDAETITTLVKNAANDGKYLYTNEDKAETTVDVVADVINNASTILNDPKFVTELTQFIDAKETVTTLTNNNNGTYTYVNESDDSVTINVVGDVANNFETIVNNPAVTNVLNNFITKSEGTVSYNAVTNEFTYTDASGTTQVVNINEIVKANETLTSLAYDAAAKTLSYKAETGPTTVINLVDLVGDTQTLTSLQVNSATGTLDYKDENNVVTPINLSAAVKEPWFSATTKAGATTNTEDIYTEGWVGIGYDTPSGKAGEKMRIKGSITTVNSTYADYVFEDYFQGFSDIKADYKFKGLAEIEEYIKTHKHLPGITPINELEKSAEGYAFNMSELSIQLLEKTEEIYLHIIEQNNAIIAKDKEIEKMNQRLERLEKLIEQNTSSNNLIPMSTN